MHVTSGVSAMLAANGFTVFQGVAPNFCLSSR
jgi:hypothetical protein